MVLETYYDCDCLIDWEKVAEMNAVLTFLEVRKGRREEQRHERMSGLAPARAAASVEAAAHGEWQAGSACARWSRLRESEREQDLQVIFALGDRAGSACASKAEEFWEQRTWESIRGR